MSNRFYEFVVFTDYVDETQSTDNRLLQELLLLLSSDAIVCVCAQLRYFSRREIEHNILQPLISGAAVIAIAIICFALCSSFNWATESERASEIRDDEQKTIANTKMGEIK